MRSPEPLIRARLVTGNRLRFHLSPGFSQAYVSQPLLLYYPPDIDLSELPQSIIDIPLITNVIAVIWLSGKVYTIEEMDEGLYHSLDKIKAFFERFFYNTAWEGELKPQRLVKNTLPEITVRSAALFTGGLDSTTTVLRHFDERPTLISFNDAHVSAVDFAKTHQLELCKIGTNFRSFLNLAVLDKISIDISKWFWDTSMGLSWAGMAAPFLYAKGIPQLYIPSGFTWQSFIFPDGQTLQQPASPLIDENLSPAGLQVYHDTFTMTRTDKVEFISTFCRGRNIPIPQLIVCTRHRKSDTTYTNCNQCTKCNLTMLDIMAVGEQLEDYGFKFTEAEFITQFQAYMAKLKMRRGGTYVACNDTQNYLKRNLERLPQSRRPFYGWFLSLDLWSMVDEPLNRPLRTRPFDWLDYTDLYPGVGQSLHMVQH